MKYLKKTAAFALCLLISASASAFCGISAFADNEDTTAAAETADDAPEESSSDGFTYHENDNGGITIEGCTIDDDELVVPAEINGKPVTELAYKAFDERPCRKITFPGTVDTIAQDNPFAPCENLEEIVIDGECAGFTVVDGVLFNKDMTTLIHYPAKKSGTSYTVPDGVLALGIAAISSTGLKEIKLPDSLDTLYRHSLSFNEELTAIDMSNTAVSDIGIMAFAACSKLESVKFSEHTINIDMAAFMSCTGLAEIELPEHLCYIRSSAFQDTALTRVKIPESVQSIGYSAFGYDVNEKPVSGFVIIGASGSAAEQYATDSDEEYNYKNNFDFMSLEDLAELEAYQALDPQTYGDYQYAIIDGTVSIVFCSSVASPLIVPSEINGIPVTAIYKNAFKNCGSASIVIPDSVKTIGENAFSQSLISLTLPGTLETIESDEEFIFCSYLREINVTEGEGGSFSSVDGVLYNRDKTVLLAYPADKADTSFAPPKSCKEIGLSAFCYNQNIEELDLSGIEKIGNYACEGCMSIKSVKFSKDLSVLGMNAFLGCSEMKSVRLYDKIEKLGDYAVGYFYDEALAADIAANPDQYAQSGQTTVMPYSPIPDFKIYADEDTVPYKYAKACGLECVTGTTEMFGNNVSKGFLYTIIGGIAAILAAVLSIFGIKKAKKKKAEKESQKRRKEAEKKIKERKSAENDQQDEKEDEQ